MARLEARNLSFSYPEEEHPVIRDFSHTFAERGITGLLGPNGIGKSTLLALLAGAYAPGAGEVLLSGRATTAFASEEEINREVTFIFQNMEFEIEATVAEVMEMVAAENPDKHHATPQELRKAFGIDKLAKLSIQKLSKGELQKVILCFALLSRPDILLLDEPVFALSREDALEALTILRDLTRQRGMLVVLTTHDLEQMERFSEQVVLFHKDGSHESGPAAELLRPEKLEAVYGTPYSLLKLPKSLSGVMEEMAAKRDSLKHQ